MIVLVIFLGILIFYFLQQKRLILPTAFPAVIMSFGIVNVGVFHLPEHTTNWTLVLFLVSTSFATAFTCQQLWLLRVHRWKETHVAVPQQAVSFGTWVAGGVILSLQFTYLYEFPFVSRLLFVFLLLCWGVYLIHVVVSAFVQRHARKLANGTYLLPTVSTQAIVIFANQLFSVPDIWNQALILTGVFFYVCSLYFLFPSIHVSKWNGTYCILHGALSITGVATVTAEAFPQSVILPFWCVVSILFLFIEGFEIVRLATRQPFVASLQPNITNWSRLFTFGMFYTFTYSLSFPPGIVETFSETVRFFLPFVVIPLLLKEVIASLVVFFRQKKVFTEST